MNCRKSHIQHVIRLWPMVFAAVFVLSGCKPGVPRKYIQPDELEDILYEYHVADAVFKMSGSGYDNKDMLAFKLSILKEHGYTEAEYDSSMLYYIRHTQRLHDVYEQLADRLSREALAQGASVGEVNKYDALTETGDTANIWRGAKALVLNPYKPFNLSTFTMKGDSTFLPGDKFILEFDTKFLCQDGMRDGMAVMALQFENDSAAAQNTRLSASNHYSLTLSDNKREGIKELKGFFQLTRRDDDQPSKSTLHLLIIENIRLVRMHTPEPPKPKQPVDSLATADTLSTLKP